MRRYGKHTDEDDIRSRPNRKGNRPRTSIRPKHEDAVEGMVLTVDRGRLTCLVDDRIVTAMKARELGRVLVLGADVRAWPVALAVRARADVVLVGVLAVAAHGRSPYAPSIPVHSSGKSGMVFAVVATFSICTPSTARPMIAPAVAMRWSS